MHVTLVKKNESALGSKKDAEGLGRLGGLQYKDNEGGVVCYFSPKVLHIMDETAIPAVELPSNINHHGTCSTPLTVSPRTVLTVFA